MINKSFEVKLMKLRLRLSDVFPVDPYYFTRILIKEGIDVGDKTIFYAPLSQTIDRERPFMLKIGNYCKITKGVTILCHDYSRSVLRRAYGDVVGEAKITSIGDNVFIGMNSTILMGANIGDNVIIGAGSVVSGVIPSNTVAGGNPCRVIRTLDEHYLIRKNKCLGEAKCYFLEFKKRYGREPSVNEMGAFFPLYLDRTKEALKSNHINTKMNGDDEEEIIDSFIKTKKVFESYDEFVRYCNEE